ncbi:MAG: diacylglycerol kinase family lipid kinase [Bacillaceae bacterium]|nr:diacylglycerol kinase family lipid kinase [Bacillaceae bacterium]
MQHLWFIINPISGNGKGKKTWDQLQRHLDAKQIPYTCFFTEREGHAAGIAQQIISEQVDADIVVVGGDGTIQNVAQGIMPYKDHSITLGFIPAGSGNDYGKAMGISRDPNEALHQFLSGQERQIDVARVKVDHRLSYAVNALGIGFDGEVASAVNQSRYKKWLNLIGLGKLSYVFGFLQVLFNYRTVSAEIHIDGNKHQYDGVWLIAVANIPYYGGGMHICPGADNTDGMFQICMVHGISRLKLLLLFPSVFAGRHIHHPYVSVLSGKHVSIKTSHPVAIHGDGEILGQTPLELNCLHQALRIRC